MQKLAIIFFLFSILLAAVLFFPPVRDFVFGNKLLPLPLPWDVTQRQVNELAKLARPGDVVVERNLHSFQWILLSQVLAGSSWVHTALVDEQGKVISMAKTVKEQDFSTYLEKQSTDIKLIRPPYKSRADVRKAIAYASRAIGTEFDPDFENQTGNCTGLVATALEAGGIEVPRRKAFIFGKPIYAAADFFKINGLKVIWAKN